MLLKFQDAKKIPLVTPRHLNESPSIFSRDRTPSRARSGPPTQKLNISAQASISKNRQVSFAPVAQSKPVASEVCYTYIYILFGNFIHASLNVSVIT